MEGESGEFHDWELLLNSPESDSVDSSDSVANTRDLEAFEDKAEGVIQTDYFSLDSNNNYIKIAASDQGSIESDNPSWVDPETESGYLGKKPRELWPDSGSDQSDDCKFGEFDMRNELGFVGNGKSLVVFDGIGEIGSGEEFSWAKKESGFVANGENQTVFRGNGKFSEIGHNSEVSTDIDVNSDVGEEISTGENEGVPSGGHSTALTEVVKAGGEGERKSVVWWKVPFELLKFCAFRVSPVWTFSMAAAVMGVIILTRRLYKMKKKSQALQLKVTLDDKNKVSQFMSRAARLNEAFSVVKRVPVIRPALPAAGGLTQWPVMSLR